MSGIVGQFRTSRGRGVRKCAFARGVPIHCGPAETSSSEASSHGREATAAGPAGRFRLAVALVVLLLGRQPALTPRLAETGRRNSAEPAWPAQCKINNRPHRAVLARLMARTAGPAAEPTHRVRVVARTDHGRLARRYTPQATAAAAAAPRSDASGQLACTAVQRAWHPVPSARLLVTRRGQGLPASHKAYVERFRGSPNAWAECSQVPQISQSKRNSLVR
jgi:hypothetical protein